jgi:hypothetical protein
VFELNLSAQLESFWCQKGNHLCFNAANLGFVPIVESFTVFANQIIDFTVVCQLNFESLKPHINERVLTRDCTVRDPI